MYVLLSAEWALAGVTFWALATGCRPQRGMELEGETRLILFVLIYSVLTILCVLQTK